MQLEENILFANRYRLERFLGRGGFSEVWLADDTLTSLKVALKVYAPTDQSERYFLPGSDTLRVIDGDGPFRRTWRTVVAAWC